MTILALTNWHLFAIVRCTMWQVELTSKATKQMEHLSRDIKDRLSLFMMELELYGPIRGNWANFGKLANGEYHCHIKRGRPTYVICYRVIDKKIKIIEVYYVGTHEKAPY